MTLEEQEVKLNDISNQLKQQADNFKSLEDKYSKLETDYNSLKQAQIKKNIDEERVDDKIVDKFDEYCNNKYNKRSKK